MESLIEIIEKFKHVYNTPMVKKDGEWSITEKGLEERNYPQSHGGKSVFEHSLWSALYVLKWYQEQNPWIDADMLDHGLDELIIGAFFHDISKASDCGWRCDEEGLVCWFDTYSPYNYGGKGENAHPEVSGDLIMGRQKFILGCPSFEQLNQSTSAVAYIKSHGHPVSLKPIFDLIGTNPTIDFQNVAVMAYMHWKIGNINQNVIDSQGTLKANPTYSYQSYLQEFNRYCSIVGITPSLSLLKKCILIAFADICASDPPSPLVGTRPETESTFLNLLIHLLMKLDPQHWKDSYQAYYPTGIPPWVRYGMDRRADAIRQHLITEFLAEQQSGGNPHQCQALTKKGQRCHNHACVNSNVCHRHLH